MIKFALTGVLFTIILGCNNSSIKNKEISHIGKDSSSIVESNYNNCLLLTNPKWVDNTTDNNQGDIYIHKYDRYFLYGFVKNVCDDTILIRAYYVELNQMGLYVSNVTEYFKNSTARILRADTLIDSIYALSPNDSIYLAITEFNLYEIGELDYFEVKAEIILNDTLISQSFPVFSNNIKSVEHN